MLSTSFSRPARSTNTTTSLNWFLISQHLHSKSSSELRSIIKHMISHSPELADLIVTPSSPRPSPRHESKSVFAVGGTTGEIDSEDSDMDISQPHPHSQPHHDVNVGMSDVSNIFASTPHFSAPATGTASSGGRKRKAFHDPVHASSPFSPVHSPVQSLSQKRHRARETSYGELTVCANCRAVFGSERHGLHECVYHPGQVVGQVWSCCGQRGDVGGCLRTRHVDARSVNTAFGRSGCGFEAESWSGQRLFGGAFGDSAMVES